MVDPDTNRTYYFNVDTEESLWERPHEYFSEEDDEDDSNRAPRGKSRWTAHEDPEYGEIYYYCAETAESVRTRDTVVAHIFSPLFYCRVGA